MSAPCDYCDRPGAYVVGLDTGDTLHLCHRCAALEKAED